MVVVVVVVVDVPFYLWVNTGFGVFSLPWSPCFLYLSLSGALLYSLIFDGFNRSFRGQRPGASLPFCLQWAAR